MHLTRDILVHLTSDMRVHLTKGMRVRLANDMRVRLTEDMRARLHTLRVPADTHTIRIPKVYGFGELDGPGMKPSAFIVMEALNIRGRCVACIRAVLAGTACLYGACVHVHLCVCMCVHARARACVCVRVCIRAPVCVPCRRC